MRIKTERAEKRSYHHGDLASVLVKIGRTMLERDGLRQFSLRALAREAGVSNAAPLHQFRNADELFSACAAQGFRDLSATLEQLSSNQAVDDVCAMADAYLNFAIHNPTVFQLMFDRKALPSPSAEFRTEASRAYNLLADAIRALGQVDEKTFDRRINAIWSLMHGFAVLELADQICRSDGNSASTSSMLNSAVRALATG